MNPLSGRQPCVSVASAVPGPVPVGPAVERVGQAADLGLVGRVAVEVGGDCQRAGEQKRRVDGGQLALPDAAAGLDVQEVVEEALVTGGVRLGPLRAVEQIAQSFAGDLRGELPDDHAALDDDRDRRQGHADGGDADRSVRVGLVADQPVVRVGLVQVVQHRGQLQPVQSWSVGSRYSRRHRVAAVGRPSVTSSPSTQLPPGRRDRSRRRSAAQTPLGTGCPSNSTDRTPRPVPAGFSTRIRYVADPWR